MIAIKHLSKTYRIGKRKVSGVEDIDLKLGDGETLAVVGPSGSGKSTLLNILGGLDQNYQGEVSIEGKELRDYNSNYYRRYIVGTIFQQFYLIPALDVEENIRLPLVFGHQLTGKEDDTRLEYLLGRVGLTKWRDHKPSELSGGQAQRVAIARALMAKPKLLLADEPTGNLDSKTGDEIINLLFDLNKEEGTTLITVTHNREVIDGFQHRIFLKDGKIESENGS